MSDNTSHPVFLRDTRLRDEYDDWVRKASQPIPASANKRHTLDEIDGLNALADKTRDQSTADLDTLDKAHSVNRSGEAGTKQATPEDKAYENGRADIMAKFTDVNARLWRQREAFGKQLETMLRQHGIDHDPQMARLNEIIRASQPATERQSYAAYATKPPPAPGQNRDQESERD